MIHAPALGKQGCAGFVAHLWRHVLVHAYKNLSDDLLWIHAALHVDLTDEADRSRLQCKQFVEVLACWPLCIKGLLDGGTCRPEPALVGIDLEGGARDRSAIMTRVCRPEELVEVQALPEAERWPNVMLRFAVKEAIYKALAPRLGRFFGFQAARVDVRSREKVEIELFLEPTDPRFEPEAELLWLDEHRVVAMVRAR